MPFLPISSTIVSNPSRAHLSLIGSWMLWPDDEARRREALASEVVVMGRDLRRQGKLDRPTLDLVFELAAHAKPAGQSFELEPYKRGMLAGHILMTALYGKDAQGKPLTLGGITRLLAKEFAPRRGDNSSFVNSIWKRYRPVSHLWAAHIQSMENVTEDELRRSRDFFPCALSDVIEFLKLSEDWRRMGESTKTAPRAPSTILKPGECVRVPDAMKFSKLFWNS
jgi:hypothetical protein